jgi:CHAT domain-containing protein/tetratricopeptide (TPR) repeat protein
VVALLVPLLSLLAEPVAGVAAGLTPAQATDAGVLDGVRERLDRAETLLRQGDAGAVEGARLVEEAVLAGQAAADPLAAAGVLHDAGLRLLQGGRVVAAAPLLRTAFELRRRHAPDSLALATSLVGVGALLLAEGEIEAAREHLERSLEIRRVSGGPLAVAESVHQLGRVAFAQGNLDEAVALWERALETREELAPRSDEVASTLHNLGLALKSQGDLQTARRYHQRSLDIHRRLDPESADVAMSFNALGNVALTEGNLDLAREHYRAALEIEQVVRSGTRYEAGPLNNLGLVAFNHGDHEAALDYYSRALELERRAAPESLGVARTLMNIGWVARDRGDRVAAREYLSQALAIEERLAPGSMQVARTLTALGTIAHDELDLERARELYLRAAAIQEERAPGSLSLAKTLDNLGNMERLLGDLERSEERHRRALEVFERLSPGSLELTFCLYNLAEAALARGRLAEAQRHAERALDIRRRWAPDSLLVADGLMLLGKVLVERNQLAAAETAYDEAWRVVGLHGRRVSGDEAMRAYAGLYRPFAETLLQLQLDRGDTMAALRTVETSRAQALLQLLVLRDGRSALLDAPSRQALEEAEAELQIARGRIEEVAALWAQVDGDAARGAERSAESVSADLAREEAMGAYTRARKQMERRLGAVRRSVTGLEEGILDLDELRATLPADSVFLSFFVGERQVKAFVVSRDPDEEVEAYDVGLSRDELAERVAALRESLWSSRRLRGVGGIVASPGDGAIGFAAASRDLYRRLFPDRIRQRLAAARRWVVSPDDVLWELPFAALDAGSDGQQRFVGLEKALTYTPSLTVLARERRREGLESAAGNALVVGDPLLAQSPAAPADLGSSWEAVLGSPVPAPSAGAAASDRWPLPGSRDEALRVGRLYGVEPILGSAATEERVRRHLGSAAVVHLSSHAFFHPQRAMSSGVLLASQPTGSPPTNEADGLLQAWELGGPLSLRAELVVLSACETGRGETTRGEGVVGLTRALQAAGARSVVATHWRIDDRGTADLMAEFHQALLAGVPKDEALRLAMVATAAAPATRHPFYWAGFLLTGDPSPLPASLLRAP